MPKMTVGELKEALDNFGNHLQVVLSTDGGEYEEFSAGAGADGDGVALCVLEND